MFCRCQWLCGFVKDTKNWQCNAWRHWSQFVHFNGKSCLFLAKHQALKSFPHRIHILNPQVTPDFSQLNFFSWLQTSGFEIQRFSKPLWIEGIYIPHQPTCLISESSTVSTVSDFIAYLTYQRWGFWWDLSSPRQKIPRSFGWLWETKRSGSMYLGCGWKNTNFWRDTFCGINWYRIANMKQYDSSQFREM